MTSDVFISYAYLDYKDAHGREIDGNIISRLMHVFDDAGISYWIDRQGLSGGDRFSEVIAEQINNAKVFLFVSTEHSNQSEWTHNEVALARQLGKRIVPLRVDDTPYAPSLMLYLAGVQYVSLAEEGDGAFEHLAQVIRSESQTHIQSIGSPHNPQLWWKRPKLWGIVCAFMTIFVMAIPLLGPMIQDMCLSPEEMVDRADSLCVCTLSPKQAKTCGESRRVIRLYRNGAEKLEALANKAVLNYNSALLYDDLDDAYRYFHDAGYAWQCVEEYGMSIAAYKRSIYYGQLLVQNFPEEHKDEYVAYSMNNLAYSYMMNGDTLLSLRTIEDAVRYHPDFMEYLDSKGELLYMAGQYKEAAAIWDTIVSSYPYYERNYWVDSCLYKQ